MWKGIIIPLIIAIRTRPVLVLTVFMAILPKMVTPQ